MEFIVEKIGMSRTVGIPSIPVTLLKIVPAKVCEIKDDNKALVAYVNGKKINKPIEGMQKKYGLSKEFNRFVELKVANTEPGDLSVEPLKEAKKVKLTFKSKGRGFAGVMKRHGFAGGPGGHGSLNHHTRLERVFRYL
jgi:large subunit ribosomal protein L3